MRQHESSIRLEIFLESKGDIIASMRTLDRELGIGNGTLGKIISRKSEVSLYVCEKLVEKFPDLNKNWLLFGEGEMLITEKSHGENYKIEAQNSLAAENQETYSKTPDGGWVIFSGSQQQLIEAQNFIIKNLTEENERLRQQLKVTS
jgi:hypothetical protein